MPPPNPIHNKLKTTLKLAISRLRMVQSKSTALSKQSRREMAALLEAHKSDSARIRVENIIRTDITVELLEILELYCELLLARLGLLESNVCDPGLEEAVKSIIYAAPRTEIKELHQVRELLMAKFGKEFSLAAVENNDGKVAERVIKKLRVDPPSQELVTLYLKEIARTYGVQWGTPSPVPSDDEDDDDEPSTHVPAEALPEHPAAVDLATAATPRKIIPKSPIHVAPQSPTTENVHPTIKFPEPPAVLKPPVPKVQPARKKPEGKVPEVDDLAARFAALKKR